MSPENRPTPPAAPLPNPSAVFLLEDGAPWTGERILRLAGRVHQAIPATNASAVVGISSPSAGFILAAVLAAWKLGRQPLLLDPSLKTEPEAVLARYPGMAVVTDASSPGAGQRIAVAEDPGSSPMSPAWPTGEQVAALFFTSGSTGEPKIVCKTVRQLFRQMEAELSWLGVPAELGVYSLAPPFHILGFVYGLFLPLQGQGTASFSPKALPLQWVADIQKHMPSLVVGVPFHFRTLASHAKGALPDTFFFSSGGPLTPDIDAAFREKAGRAITQGYGSTETGGIAKRTGFGAWRPFPGLEWRIGDDGRLVVRSAWQENPSDWHTCDDVVSAEGDGFVLLGRSDSVVKVAGKRFSTDEVVAAAQAVTGVGEAAAVAYERFGENAVALFVSRAAGSALDSAALREALGAKLAAFKVPRTIEVADELPHLGNGKIDRQKLRGMILTGTPSAPHQG